MADTAPLACGDGAKSFDVTVDLAIDEHKLVPQTEAEMAENPDQGGQRAEGRTVKSSLAAFGCYSDTIQPPVIALFKLGQRVVDGETYFQTSARSRAHWTAADLDAPKRAAGNSCPKGMKFFHERLQGTLQRFKNPDLSGEAEKEIQETGTFYGCRSPELEFEAPRFAWQTKEGGIDESKLPAR